MRRETSLSELGFDIYGIKYCEERTQGFSVGKMVRLTECPTRPTSEG